MRVYTPGLQTGPNDSDNHVRSLLRATAVTRAQSLNAPHRGELRPERAKRVTVPSERSEATKAATERAKRSAHEGRVSYGAERAKRVTVPSERSEATKAA